MGQCKCAINITLLRCVYIAYNYALVKTSLSFIFIYCTYVFVLSTFVCSK